MRLFLAFSLFLSAALAFSPAATRFWSAPRRHSCYRRPWRMRAQAVEDGIQLPPAEAAEADAEFLSSAVRLHLDQEWMPQDVHRVIGDEVATVYKAMRKNGATELTDVMMAVGAALQNIDMEEAFVNGWDVANLVSDFMLVRMGRGGCECNTAVPEGVRIPGTTVSENESSNGIVAVSDRLARLSARLSTEFERYRWLADFLDEQETWEEMNIVMAVNLGLIPFGGTAKAPPPVNGPRPAWAAAFGTDSVPDFSASEIAEKMLVSELPGAAEDCAPAEEEAAQGLEDFVATLFGEEAKRQADETKDKSFARRSLVVKWLYYADFLKRPLSAARPSSSSG